MNQTARFQMGGRNVVVILVHEKEYDEFPGPQTAWNQKNDRTWWRCLTSLERNGPRFYQLLLRSRRPINGHWTWKMQSLNVWI